MAYGLQNLGYDINQAKEYVNGIPKRTAMAGVNSGLGAVKFVYDTKKGIEAGVESFRTGLSGVKPDEQITPKPPAVNAVAVPQNPSIAAKPAAQTAQSVNVPAPIPTAEYTPSNEYNTERASGLPQNLVNTVSYAPYMKEAADAKAKEDQQNALQQGIQIQQAARDNNLARAQAEYDKVMQTPEGKRSPGLARSAYEAALQAGGANNAAGLNVGMAEKSMGEQGANTRMGLQEAGQNERSAAQLAQTGSEAAAGRGLREQELALKEREYRNQLQETGAQTVTTNPITNEVKTVREKITTGEVEQKQKMEQEETRQMQVSVLENPTPQGIAAYEAKFGHGSYEKLRKLHAAQASNAR